MAGYVRWLMGRDAMQRHRQYEEQTLANGVIRQTLDPDQALLQQQRIGPYRAGETQAAAQRVFDQQGQGSPSTPGLPQFVAQVEAQQRLVAQRQAEQDAQRRGRAYGR
jgi:hypothetical protein